jgi:Putative mono-oxygenase ydhR
MHQPQPASNGLDYTELSGPIFVRRKNMVTSITRFQLPPGIPLAAIKKGFVEVAPEFKQPSGLLRKYFLISEDGKTGGGVYLWNSMGEARTFSEGVLRAMIKEKFQIEPSIEYYDAPVIVDNVTCEIIADGAQHD